MKKVLFIVLMFFLCIQPALAETKFEITESIQIFEDSDLPEDLQAKQAWQHYSVDSFRARFVTRGHVSVELLDYNKNIIGTINFEILDEIFEIMSFKGSDGTHITLKKNKAWTFFIVTDHVSGISQEANLKPGVGWIKTDDAKLFFETNEDSLILMLSIHHNIFAKKNYPNESFIDSSEIDVRIACYGSYYRGSATGSTKSYCCQNATNDANNKCSNSYCWGCCSFLSCDAVCGIGDYGCSCGITGRACSG